MGAREHNLRDIDVSFPLGCFVAVTGVSGSGKSTLVNDILYTVLANKLNGARQVPGRHTTVRGLEHLDKVVHVDQSPIGRTPRSNPATYTGVFDHIRKLFAETTEAKVRGYLPGRFSFNVKGGRCETCAGDGTIKIEMNFLPDVYVPCEVCHGARYNRETLEVHFKGKTIADVLDMPIEEAAEFFAAVPGDRPAPGDAQRGRPRATSGSASRRRPCPAARRSGSSWPASCRSGRPAARSTSWTSRPPGCTSRTSASCWSCCQGLVDKGNTVVVIEHNLDVIKSADWIVDMGPDGGSGGGMVIAEGTPEDVAADPDSYTGQFLAPVLAGRARRGAATRKKTAAAESGRRRASSVTKRESTARAS